MASSTGVVSLMGGGYFVSRGELLEWLNGLLELDYTKVEQVCNAAAVTQVMDVLFPGKVQMSKINYNAQHEYERIANFKVLQAAFDRQKIDRHLDVDKLVKGRYQDNLEFLQWTKCFFDLHANQDAVDEYNAKARRASAKCTYKGDAGISSASSRSTRSSSSSSSSASASASSRSVRRTSLGGSGPADGAARRGATTSTTATAGKENTTRPKRGTSAASTGGRRAATSSTAAAAPTANPRRTAGAAASSTATKRAATKPVATGASSSSRTEVAGKTAPAAAKADPVAAARISGLESQVAELELAREGAVRERDFYFGRLREIELMMGDMDQDDEVVKQVLAVLYKPPDEEDGLAPEELDGEEEEEEAGLAIVDDDGAVGQPIEA